MSALPILDLSALFAPARPEPIEYSDDRDMPELPDRTRAEYIWRDSNPNNLELMIVSGVWNHEDLHMHLYAALRASEGSLPAAVQTAWDAIREVSIAVEAGEE